MDWNPSPFKVNLEPGNPVGWPTLMAGVTVKLVLAPFPLDPEATMVKRPPGAIGMVRSAAQTPRVLASTSTPGRLLPAVTVIRSRDRAPEPLTLTTVPGSPLLGTILNPDTRVILVVLTSPAEVEEPEALMVWVPAVALGASKVVDHTPWESAEMPEATLLPPKVTEIPVSPDLNPVPLTLIMSPGEAWAWATERRAVTLKVAWSPPEGLVIAMDLEPPEVLEGISTVVRILPWLSALAVLRISPSIVMSTSEPGLKPEALTVTELPGGPLEGVTLKDEVILKERVIMPTRTWYVPEGSAGTSTLELKEPLESAPIVAIC